MPPTDPEDILRERARHHGREAFYAGHELSDCPHADSSPLREEWVNAYEAARLLRQLIDERLMREG